VKKADIHLHVEGDMLTLSAEKRGEKKEEDAEHTYRVVERFSGDITTSLSIPQNTDKVRTLIISAIVLAFTSSNSLNHLRLLPQLSQLSTILISLFRIIPSPLV
jgi:hypothetical protein